MKSPDDESINQISKDGVHILGVSENSGTPKSSMLIGFSIINHPFWGYPYFWKPPFACELGVFDAFFIF